jgi:7,8-dihydropterin-6-yl-methyl-4-(beta-D-ribofuranosyl)aminobenzene 5'-phosphate synthase
MKNNNKNLVKMPKMEVKTLSSPSNSTICISILVENTVQLPGLKAEHGWSVLIESNKGRILFDTGQSSLLLANAKPLGLDLSAVDKIVISHGHYDHTGGLADILQLNSKAQVYAHPDIFKCRFYLPPMGGEAREIGVPAALLNSKRFNLSHDSVILFPGCLNTGEIPKSQPDLTVKHFFEDRAGTRPDLIKDDQALILESRKGLIVILGCCHSGLKATFDRVKALTGQTSIYMVIGGMHLNGASAKLMKQTIQTLREYSVQRIGLGHCTGAMGTFALQTEFPDRCFPCPTGLRMSID